MSLRFKNLIYVMLMAMSFAMPAQLRSGEFGLERVWGGGTTTVGNAKKTGPCESTDPSQRDPNCAGPNAEEQKPEGETKNEDPDKDKKKQEKFEFDPDCKDARDTAVKACTTQDMQAGMNPQQQQQGQQLMGQANQANQNVANAGANTAEQCKNQMDLSKILGALSGLKGAACMAAIGECNDMCGKAEKWHQAQWKAGKNVSSNKTDERRSKSGGKMCDGLGGNAAAAIGQALGSLMNAFQNQKCAEEMMVTQTPGASPTPAPSATPPTIAIDCTNEVYAKTNVTCICQVDKSNPICGAPNTNTTNTGSTGTGSSVGPMTPSSYGDDDDSEGQAIDMNTPKANPQTGGAEGGSSGGGGGFGGGSGGGGSRGAGGEGAPKEGEDKKVISGGGGGGGGSLSGSGGGGGGGSNSGGGGRDRKDKDFDLSKFMPKNLYKNRGLAGLGVTGKDGITGPMGPSIWEKVTNQYQLQKPNLIQDR